jgi:hypothetical protein
VGKVASKFKKDGIRRDVIMNKKKVNKYLYVVVMLISSTLTVHYIVEGVEHNIGNIIISGSMLIFSAWIFILVIRRERGIKK